MDKKIRMRATKSDQITIGKCEICKKKEKYLKRIFTSEIPWTGQKKMEKKYICFECMKKLERGLEE